MLQLVMRMAMGALVSCSMPAFASPEALKEIDSLIANNKIAEAESQLDEQLKADPKAPLLLVRKSRLLSLKGDAASDKDTKVKLFEESRAMAVKLTETHPQVAGGHLRAAVAAGKLALYQGILQSRSLILEVKSYASKVLELSEKTKYEEALAHYLLGRAHLKVAEKPKAMRLPLGLGWADKKVGADHLEKAATLSPDTIPFVLHHAEQLAEKGEKAKAKELLELIKTLEVKDPADVGHKQEAAQLLTRL